MDLNKVKKLIVDLDDTISVTENGDYVNSKPIQQTIDLLKKYQAEGFQIIIHSSRQMRTYEANVGKINIYTYNMSYEEIKEMLKKEKEYTHSLV